MLAAPDSAAYGVLPVIDPTDGPFMNAGASFGAITSLPMLRPTVEIAPVFYKQGLLYEDQEGQDSSGTTGRNGRSICNNATDPAWLDRLSAYIQRHEGINGQSPSHYSIYLSQFQTMRPQDGIEAIVFASGTSQDVLKKKIFDYIVQWTENDAKPQHTQLDFNDLTTEKLDAAAGCSIDYEIKEQRGVIVG